MNVLPVTSDLRYLLNCGVGGRGGIVSVSWFCAVCRVCVWGGRAARFWTTYLLHLMCGIF